MKVRVKIETTIGMFEATFYGDAFPEFVRRLLAFGYWLNDQQTDWLAPSQIMRAWIV